MQITGKVKKVFDTQEVTSSFKKREIVVTTQEQYPQDILIEFHQDKCELLNACKPGAEVVIGINIRGKEWINKEGVAKYFNSIQGWKIGTPENQNTQSNQPPTAGPTESSNQANGDEDDLSF